MTALDGFALRAVVALAIAMLMCGVFASWVSSNAIKRMAAIVIAAMGALIAAAALGAPAALLVAGAIATFAQLAVAVSVSVRLQETYGAVEASETDAADARDEASGPAP